MGLGRKGKQVLKNVDYDVFRQAFIKAVMENIREKGVSGQYVQDVIRDTLDEQRFKLLVKDSLRNIAKETDMSPKECKDALPLLVEEDVAEELNENLEGEVHSEEKKKRIFIRKENNKGYGII